MKFPCIECTNSACDAPKQTCAECLRNNHWVAFDSPIGQMICSGTFNGTNLLTVREALPAPMSSGTCRDPDK